MIDPVSGFAPYPWMQLGKVLICRRDRVPITPDHYYVLGDFMSCLLDRFGDPENDQIHKRYMDKAKFLQFIQSERNP